MTSRETQDETKQDYQMHMHRLFIDANYARWTERFRALWHRCGFVSHGHLPHVFVIAIYEAGYEPEEGLEIYMRADAEAYARWQEASTTAFVEARD